jgi:transposase
MPLYALLKAELLAQGVIHADETPLKVIREEKITCYMWVYCSGEDRVNKSNKAKSIVLFDYQNSRAAQFPIDFLEGYNDYLQVVGYAAYGKTDAILAGCMAHARRKFIEAKTAQGKSKTGKADVMLNLIGKLYGIEANIKLKSRDEKSQVRQKKSKPLIDKINQWFRDNREKIPPKSKPGEAFTYWHNQAHKLETYLKDGRINIDKNRAERAVKPFVIGRKNWLFSNTSRGAMASANLYSFVETAKANGLMVDSYLQICLDELAKNPDNLEYLLPWNINQG